MLEDRDLNLKSICLEVTVLSLSNFSRYLNMNQMVFCDVPGVAAWQNSYSMGHAECVSVLSPLLRRPGVRADVVSLRFRSW